jgi:hypothetical protein
MDLPDNNNPVNEGNASILRTVAVANITLVVPVVEAPVLKTKP